MIGRIAKKPDIGTVSESLSRRSLVPLAAGFCLASRNAVSAPAQSPFDYSGRDRQAFLEQGARREGHLTFYSSLIPNLGLKAIVDGFRNGYPFVTLETWRGTEINIAQKTLAELRAGHPAGDLLEGSELA